MHTGRLAGLALALLVLAACGEPTGAGPITVSDQSRPSPTPSTTGTSPQSESSASPSTSPATTTTPLTTPSDSGNTLDPGSGGEEDESSEEVGLVPTAHNSLVATAVADLAGRLDVSPESIDVAFVEEVTWPDGSLGCPQPGMSYTQALVEGLRIGLSYDGTDYVYHTALAGTPFLCTSSLSIPPDAIRTIVIGEKEPPPTIGPPSDK